ncbi:MAG: BON domain-containing protein [Gemmatimonadales bacterium]|nr:BON domain-containing protein [Gemmatimonadales bacterium]
MLGNLELQKRVLEALDWEPGLDAKAIGVAAADGVVTLTGQVRNWADRFLAERVVKQLFGVRALANDLEVRLPVEARRSDTDLATAALRALEWDVEVPHERIRLGVDNGWISMDGTVEWHYQRFAAERAVRHLTGVRGVTNRIALQPRVTPADLKTRIESALRRHAEVDARSIQIETHGGNVALDGLVHSWAERDEVERAVWAAPGVVAIDDRLVVTA